MEKGNLFFDFDNTKFDTNPSLAAYMNWTYKINSVPDDYLNNKPLDLVVKQYRPDSELTLEEAYIHHGMHYQTSMEWHKDVLPMKDMEKVLPKLAKEYRLWTVTLRDISGIPIIEYLLDKYVPKCISGIHCVHERRDGTILRFPKKDFIASIQGERVGFFDDSPHEIVQAQDMLPSYLFGPSEPNEHTDRIVRQVANWQEIADLYL